MRVTNKGIRYGLKVWIFVMCLLAWAAQAQAGDDAGSSCAEASAATLDGIISGAIDFAGDYDYFAVNIPATGSIRVYSTGTADIYGTLKDSACDDIVSDDNSGGGAANFYMLRNVPAGTYYVAVRHADPLGTGAYALTVDYERFGPANILLMLDNSGSMNFPAYPDPYNPDVDGISNGTKLNGATFKGAGCQIAVHVTSGNDDAEERLSDHAISYCGTDWRSHTTLDMSKSAYLSLKVNNTYCTEYAEQVTGIRFQGINIPRTIDGMPVVITSAQIVFTAAVTSANGNISNLYIAGQAADDAAGFTTAASDISGRAETAANVTWADVGAWTVNSQANATTPDLKAIVQEIINRPGWTAGNDMVFKITGDTGSRRRAYSYNGSSTKAPKLAIAYEPCVIQKYYGYFNADARYRYANNVFSQDPSGAWDGNFLNWVSMRRVDVLRKALMGGKKPCESCSGKAHLQGEVPAQTSRYWQTYYLDAGTSLPPTPYTEAWYGVKDGKLYVKTTTDPYTGNNPWTSPDGTFVVEVAIDQEVEPELFCADGEEAGNPCGVVQRAGADVRLSTLWFSETTNEGGRVAIPFGYPVQDIIRDVQNTSMQSASPQAETLYTAMKYFVQDSSLPSGYLSSALPMPVAPGSSRDPFYEDGSLVPNAQSFVLMVTDGVSTEDKNIPSSLQSYDGDMNATTRSYDSNGSDYLDDVALYAHVNDLRPEINARQRLVTDVVYAFGKDPSAEVLLKETAMNGGFLDINANNKPDGYLNNGNFTARPALERTEWDADGDGIPDNYYDAQDGFLLEAKLQEAIAAMVASLERTRIDIPDNDGDGYTFLQGDFDDYDPAINPEATEICNGIDDNCDGQIDEGACSNSTTTVLVPTTTILPATSTTTEPPTTTTTAVADADGDGIADAADNCLSVYNPQQHDADGDTIGDVCDSSPGCGGCGQSACEAQPTDTDGDGIADGADNCPGTCNDDQRDADGDGTGDVCDTSPGCGGCGQPACDTVCIRQTM